MSHTRTNSEVESELNRLNTLLWDYLMYIAIHEDSEEYRKKDNAEKKRKMVIIIQNKMRTIGWAFFKERDVESRIDRAYTSSTGRTLGERRQAKRYARRYEI